MVPGKGMIIKFSVPWGPHRSLSSNKPLYDDFFVFRNYHQFIWSLARVSERDFKRPYILRIGSPACRNRYSCIPNDPVAPHDSVVPRPMPRFIWKRRSLKHVLKRRSSKYLSKYRYPSWQMKLCKIFSKTKNLENCSKTWITTKVLYNRNLNSFKTNSNVQ